MIVSLSWITMTNNTIIEYEFNNYTNAFNYISKYE